MSKEINLDYTDHYVAFLDILGFRNLMQDKQKLQKYFQLALDTAEDVEVSKTLKGHSPDLNYKIISDSVILAIPATSIENLTSLCAWIAYFQFQCAVSGIWLRGGISRGEFFFKENITVGQALVDAFDLEQKESKQPRVILDPTILSSNDMDRTTFCNRMGDCIFNITDSGELRSVKLQEAIFIDYLNFFLASTQENKFDKLKKLIAQLKKSIYSKQKFYGKHMWTKDYLLEVLMYGSNSDFQGRDNLVNQLAAL